MNAKTTICSTSPFAMESMMLVGNVCSRICDRLVVVCATAAVEPFCNWTPDAGLDQIHRAQTDEERDGGHNLEVEKRLAADAAHGLDVARAGNTGNQRGEQQRRNDRLDQAQENRPENRACFSGPGKERRRTQRPPQAR